MAKEKKLKKLEYVKQWTTVKKIANKNMMKRLKSDLADAKADKDKEAMAKVALHAKLWKGFNNNFKLGLTPTMKALYNAKTVEEQVKQGKSVLKIIGLYEKMINKFISDFPGRVPDYNYTVNLLTGMLNRVQKDLKKAIK